MEQFENTESGLIVRAPAKINLALLIAGKRSDGYHEIETVMSKIDWYDELLFQKGHKDGVELICTGEYWAPEGEENLVYRACRMAMEMSGKTLPVKVTLRKNIPAGTGLGSASSDAAAALMGINKFGNFGLTEGQLQECACKLGSDVAFFLYGPTAFCTGRGENVHAIESEFKFGAVLFLPNVSVSTKRIYENYKHESDFYNRHSGLIKGYLKEAKIDLCAKICVNMLEKTCFNLHSELSQLKYTIEILGIRPVCLSGSGSTLYYLSDIINIGQIDQSALSKSIGCKCKVVNNNRW